MCGKKDYKQNVFATVSEFSHTLLCLPGDMSGEDMLQMALRMAEMSESGGANSAAAANNADQPHLDLEDISHGGDMSTMLAAQQQAAHAELLAQQQMAMVNKKARQDKRVRAGDARGGGSSADKKRPKVYMRYEMPSTRVHF